MSDLTYENKLFLSHTLSLGNVHIFTERIYYRQPREPTSTSRVKDEIYPEIAFYFY